MRSIFTMAAAALAASQMAWANSVYPDVRDADRRRDTPTTFKFKRCFQPYLGNIDLLGKSHSKGVSKRRRQRAGASHD